MSNARGVQTNVQWCNLIHMQKYSHPDVCLLQDEENPVALLADLCLAQVCHSLDFLCSTQADGSLCLSWAPVLPQEIADQLLRKMATDGKYHECLYLQYSINTQQGDTLND